MKTIAEALDRASEQFARAGIEDPHSESEFMLAALLGCQRTDVRLRRTKELETRQRERLEHWIDQRAQRKPLAYVTGEQPFFDASYEVSPDVLVPRPETELLVEQAYAFCSTREASQHAIDVGTGSGVIALSLARHPRVDRVTAIDKSPAALVIARRNAERLGVSNVSWKECDLLEGYEGPEAGLIAANLPYVERAELMRLAPELHWEPRLALDGGEDGLDFIRRLIDQAPAVLAEGGALFLEIGASQGTAVAEYLTTSGRWQDIRVNQDLAGLPRIVRALRKGS
jgi:release factor glutamine methyltransferase